MLTLFVRVTSMYAGEGMDNHYFTEVHDIYVKDLKCKKVNVAALVLQGTEEKPIYNVTFDNVDVDKAGIGLSFSNTKTIGPYFDYTTWGGCLYSGFCFFTAR